jgi:hypothetical protein
LRHWRLLFFGLVVRLVDALDVRLVIIVAVVAFVAVVAIALALNSATSGAASSTAKSIETTPGLGVVSILLVGL